MTIDEIGKALKRMALPSFVKVVRASTASFNTHAGVRRDYCLFVELSNDELNPYLPVELQNRRRACLSNHAASFPADEDELRAQVVAAVLMAVAHEAIEQVTNGGRRWCAPHQHKGGSPADTEQWLGLHDALYDVVTRYAETMPA